MKIIPARFELDINLGDGMEMLRRIEQAGRTCYRSEDNNRLGELDKTKKFIMMILERGHESVLEHEKVTVRIICDRGISHELVRHRIASYCLSGDTEVVAYRKIDSSANSQKKWTLGQLYSWQNDPKRSSRIKLIRLRSLNKAGVLVPGVIKKIHHNGEAQTFQVRTVSGRQIRATAGHQFITQAGEKTTEKLQVGDRIYANGIPALDNADWLFQKYIVENNTLVEMSKLIGCCTSLVTRALRAQGINKPLSVRKNRKPGHGRKGMFSQEARKKISRRMTGSGNPHWKGDSIKPSSGRQRANKMFTPDKCWGCTRTDHLERDHNPKNNKRSNIKFLCQKHHKAFHYGPGVLTAFLDEVASIKPWAIEPTFDVEMRNEEHNFVANGLVVHNSQESSRYCNYSSGRFGGEITFIDLRHFLANPEARKLWEISIEQAERNYMELTTQHGVSPQFARSILPNSLKTEIVVTANLREWRHIFKLRTSKAAHPQMQEIMGPLLQEFQQCIPVVFDDIEVGV